MSLPSLYRQGQIDRVTVYAADITSLIQRHRCELEPVLQRSEPHLIESDPRELRGIVRDIQARIARFEPLKEP